MEAAPAAIPVKPNMAAMIAITIKITAHLSIKFFLVIIMCLKCMPNYFVALIFLKFIFWNKFLLKEIQLFI